MIIKKEKILFIILILSFIFYFLFQTKHFFIESNIEFNYKNNTIVSENKILFNGKGKYLKSLSINNEKIFLDLDGDFSKEIYLYEGKNMVNIKYENTFNEKFEKNIIIFKQ